MMKNIFTRRSAIKKTGLAFAALAIPKVLSSAQPAPVKRDKRTIFITGGARGIGLQTAIDFANEGDNIVLYDIAEQIKTIQYPLASETDLEEATEAVKKTGASCLSFKGDVRSKESLVNAVSESVAKFGAIDVLVANAAVTHYSDTSDYNDDSISDILEINVAGVLKSIQSVIPVFIKQNHGKIITLSSIAGRGGSPMFSLYAASKWAVIGLTKSIAMELGYMNITCNTVCPTSIDTPMSNNDFMNSLFDIEGSFFKSADDFYRTQHALPIGMLPPSDVSSTILYLASEKANHITGTAIDVAAGFTAKNNA
jgi:NAD(P)-dependent dehydrogenase (short-subunit alcohol dehydrogenase family)